MSIRRYMSNIVPQIIRHALPLTETMLNQYMNYTNSLPYLMRFWVHVTEHLHRTSIAIVNEINPTIQNLVETYITVHIKATEMFINDREDDPLNMMDSMQAELECVGKMVRTQLETGVHYLCKLWDMVIKEYTVRFVIYE